MTTQEELERLECEYLEQRALRRMRVIKALTKDVNPTISVGELAKALGPGITNAQLTNAAWENHLPFGWAYRGDTAKNKQTTILKDVFWDWYNSAAFVRWSESVGLKAA
ncbi:hypothetical protein [Eubacterium sp.]|uniref:hypothetical protein n=1 Tax=Eubacterium sp. TaxID=142586 RepID=UPI002FC868DE